MESVDESKTVCYQQHSKQEPQHDNTSCPAPIAHRRTARAWWAPCPQWTALQLRDPGLRAQQTAAVTKPAPPPRARHHTHALAASPILLPMWLAIEMAQGHSTVRARNLGFLSKDIQTCLRLMAELLSKFRAKSQTVVGICYHPPVDIHSPNCSFITILNCLWGNHTACCSIWWDVQLDILTRTPRALLASLHSKTGSSIPWANL